ncbi:MAG: CobW family GTP-binding protein [Burkholderiales bacterium]
MDLSAGKAVSVAILTGFLGAGKTTLLNRILSGGHGLRVAVLVNDFGAINIDSDLVVGVESGGDVISLANGCVCCNIRDDLLAAVQQVIERPERPEYIVLEASGVAEPSGIAVTFLDAGLRDRIRLDSILCVVDASQIFAAPELMELKLRQIAFADMLLLNKADLVSREEIGRIKAWLDEHFHRYRLVESTRGDVPLEILLASGRFDPATLEPDARQHGHGHEHDAHSCHDPQCEQHHHDHAQTFSTWSYETDVPLSLDLLRETARKLPASVYRCKGVVHSADAPGRRAVLQVVGKRVDLTLESEWGERTPRTRLVAIGARGAVDGDTLRASLDRCVVGPGRES